MSRQSYALIRKIREVDNTMTPEMQRRVFEVHPEVSFWALNEQQPVLASKRTPEGQQQRLDLLSQVFQDDLSRLLTRPGYNRDDVLDACAAAWTAWRYARGEHGTLPENPPKDSRGLRMEIVY